MPIAWDPDVLNVAPELATGSPVITTAAQNFFIALATALVADPEVWGTFQTSGQIYLAAHLGQLSRLRGRGPITSEALGPASRAYASLVLGESDLMLTTCGRMYMTLIKGTTAIFGFTG